MNRRVPAFVAVFAALVAMLVLAADPPRGVDAGASATDNDTFGVAVAAPADALSSTWFCAGGTGEDSEVAFADHTVIVANPTDTALAGTLTVYGGGVRQAPSIVDQLEAAGDATTTTTASSTTTTGPAEPQVVSQPIEVPALGRTEVLLRDVVESELVAAVVELPGGEVAVEHRVESINGSDTAPCASQASTEWHFAWGATTDDARELLVFFNPFPDDAVIDGSFITDDGPREPTRFDGLVIPSGSVVGLDLGQDVTIREQIAGSLRLRSGRVVVDRIVRFDGSDGRRGLTVRSGVTQPKPIWIFPDGLIGEGIQESIHIYNPTDESAEILIDVTPDDTDTNDIPEPFDVSVQPGAQVSIDIGADGRVAPDVGHSLTVRVLNDSAVVAERVLSSKSPADRSGVSVTNGSPVAAPTWVFAAGGTGDDQDEFLYLVNPSNEFLVTFSVARISGGQAVDIPELTDVELPAAGRLAIRLGSLIRQESLPVIVTASAPVVVERGLYAAEGPGISNAMGVPLRDGLVEPPAFLTGEAAEPEAEPAPDDTTSTTGDPNLDGPEPPPPPEDTTPEDTTPEDTTPDTEPEPDGGN